MLVIGTAIPSALTGAVIVGFEHGNIGLYTEVKIEPSASNFSIVPGAAHDGHFGARFADTNGGDASFYYRSDVQLSPGHEYSGFFRADGSFQVYLSVFDGSDEFFGMLAETQPLESGLQIFSVGVDDGLTFDYKSYGSVSYTFAQDTWYSFRLDWLNNGLMSASAYDQSGHLVASTGYSQTGFTHPGSLTVRGFAFDNTGAISAPHVDLDTITESTFTVIPEPTTLVGVASAITILLFVCVLQPWFTTGRARLRCLGACR